MRLSRISACPILILGISSFRPRTQMPAKTSVQVQVQVQPPSLPWMNFNLDPVLQGTFRSLLPDYSDVNASSHRNITVLHPSLPHRETRGDHHPSTTSWCHSHYDPLNPVPGRNPQLLEDRQYHFQIPKAITMGRDKLAQQGHNPRSLERPSMKEIKIFGSSPSRLI